MSNLVFDESSSNREASHGYAWWFSGDTFEKAMVEDRKPRKRGLTRRLVNHPGRLTIFYFLTLAVLSTTLLMTPIATPKDETTTFTTAFFTAVSAISTCGISIVNSTTHWTTFGQGVLIFAVQMGGLGVMTFASLIALAVNHHLKATQRMLTANELGTTKLGEIKGVLTVVITTAFVIEGITFVALFPGLYKVNHGNVHHALWESLFFAVMAYNNAGFTPDGAGLHVNNWAVGLPILASAFCGTLGFPVLLNLMRSWRMRRPPKRWSLHTKLTLTTTFCIVIASFTWFLLMEWNNKLLFAGDGIEPRLWHAMVAAVMPRSSGFDLSWMPGVSDATKVFLSIVMFIGGGSTSTAGGIRVTTFAVILLTCRAAFTGRHDINAFHRRIHTQAVGRKHGMPHAGHRGIDGADDHHRLLAVRRTVRYLLRVRTGRLLSGRSQRKQPHGTIHSRRHHVHRASRTAHHRLRDFASTQSRGRPLPHRANRGRLTIRLHILAVACNHT